MRAAGRQQQKLPRGAGGLGPTLRLIPPAPARWWRMLTHTVLFWLRDDLTVDQRSSFETHLRTLLAIPGSLRAVIGRPAATEARPVVDHSYDYALELDFADVPSQDVYQAHPVHQAFIANCHSLWRQVRVMDFEHLP